MPHLHASLMKTQRHFPLPQAGHNSPIYLAILTYLALNLISGARPPVLAQESSSPANQAPPSSPAEAEAEKDGRREEEDDEPFLLVGADFSSASEIEFTDSDGQFDVTNTGISIELPIASLEYRQLDFDWEGAETLEFANGSTEPWEQLKTLSISGMYPKELSPRPALGSGMLAGSSGMSSRKRANAPWWFASTIPWTSSHRCFQACS